MSGSTSNRAGRASDGGMAEHIDMNAQRERVRERSRKLKQQYHDWLYDRGKRKRRNNHK